MGGESVKLVTVSLLWCDSLRGLKREREGKREGGKK